MPVPVFNYAALPTQGNKFLEGLMPAIQAGMKLGYTPQNLSQDLKSKQLANALSQIQLNYAPQMSQAQLQSILLGNKGKEIDNQYAPQLDQARLGQMGASTNLTNLQAKYLPQSEGLANALKQLQLQSLQQKINDPLGGKFLPGDAGQLQALDRVKQAYGEDSDIYKNLKDEIDTNRQLNKSKFGYYSTRGLSTPSKSIVEEDYMKSGLGPNGLPLKNADPYYLQQLVNQSQNKRLKNSITEKVLNRNTYARNVESTLGKIDPDALTGYGGIFGTAEKIGQGALSSAGWESKNYDQYRKSVAASEALAEQLTQFWGSSIQPEQKRVIQYLSNPSNWYTNPKLARQMFDQFSSILHLEMQNLQSATQSPNIYTGQGAQLPAPQSSQPVKIRTYDPATRSFK